MQLVVRLARRAWVDWVLVLVLCSTVYLVSPISYTGGDTALTYPTAVSMVHGRDLELGEFGATRLTKHYSWWDTDHGAFTKFPWTPSLFLVPVVVGVDTVAAISGRPDAEGELRSAGRGVFDVATRHERVGAAVVMACCVVVLGLLVEQRLRARGARRAHVSALVAGLSLAFSTSAWSVVGKAMWQHGPSMMLAGLALLCAGRLERADPRTRRVLAVAALMGVAMGAAETVRPTNAVPLVLFAVWVGRRHRRWLAAYVVGVVAAVVPWLAVNAISFGRLLPPYFRAGRLGWHEHFLTALAANLVSPSRGLFVFSPVLLLAVAGALIARRRGEFDALLSVSVASAVGIYVACSAYRHWWGGDSFGQRFLAETFPYLVVLAVPAIDAVTSPSPTRSTARRRVVGVLLAGSIAWGVVVNWQGAFLRASICWTRLPHPVSGGDPRFWSVTDSQPLRGLRVMIDEGSYAAAAHQPCPPGRS